MPENNDKPSLRDFILEIKKWGRFLLSKWLIIVLAGILGAGGGFLYAINKKPTYTGTLTFVLSNNGQGGGGLASLAGQFGVDIGGGAGNGAFEGENIIELLKSKRIIKGALFKVVPEENDILINIIAKEAGFLNTWKGNARLSKQVPFKFNVSELTPVQDSLVGVIYRYVLNNNLSVGKQDKKLSFYRATATSSKELVAVYLAKNVVAEAAKLYIDTKTKVARENLNMLQYEADSLKSRLGGTINSSANRIDQTFNLNPALQSQRAVIQQNQVQAQVLIAAYGEVVKNLEIAKISLQKETPLYQVIDEPQSPLVKEKFGKLKGLLLGGIFFAFASALLLILKRGYKMLLNN